MNAAAKKSVRQPEDSLILRKSILKPENGLTQDAGDSLQVEADQMFSLGLHPKIDHDHICCHAMDLNDLNDEPNDLYVELQLHLALVLLLNLRNKTAISSNLIALRISTF